MKRSPVSTKYALALFRAASQRNIVDAVEGDLQSLQDLLRKDPRFVEFLGAPHVTEEHKRRFVTGVLKGRVHVLVEQFVDLLLAKGRFGYLAEAIEHYIGLVEAARGIAHAQAVSAIALTDPQRKNLQAGLERLTGKTIRLSESVDPGVLGGVVLTVGNRVMDGSLRTALRQLREKLLGASIQGSFTAR